MVWAHLPSVSRYRQTVHFVPLALGRPVWVDDTHFNLRYHLRRTALASPGGDEELRRTWSGASCPNSSTAASRYGRCRSSRDLSEGRWAIINGASLHGRRRRGDGAPD